MAPTSIPIHIVLPAYNEAEVIREVIREIQKHLDCSIYVIDDGSTDNTAQAAREAGAQVVRHPINRGAGAACMTGILLARRGNWPYVAFMDADGQHQAKDLLRMYNHLQEECADLVIGSRFMEQQGGIPGIRRFYNQIANLLTNAFCKNSYSDTQSGFRLLNERAITQIELFQDEFSYCSEMIIQAEQEDLVIAECPISVRYTEYSMRKGQDLQVGIMTAFHFMWKLLFK